jgi:hypothetical protein
VLSLKVEVEVWQSTMNLKVSFQTTRDFEQLDSVKKAQMDAQLSNTSADLHVIVFVWDFVFIQVVRNFRNELFSCLELMQERLCDKHVVKKRL